MPSNNLTQLFTGIANAIRAKKGTNSLIAPTNFATEIAALSLSLPNISMESFINAINISPNDRICVMWDMIYTGASGTITTTNATITYSYFDDVNYTRNDPYVKITNTSTSVSTFYWQDDINSSYIQVPYNLGNYQSHTTYHTNNGSHDLDVCLMLLRTS
ncbi:MAG: hypothetical protein J6Y43_05020 [Clostridia bacterium]|nr:hypothetical protein [Clostridia bacterium]